MFSLVAIGIGAGRQQPISFYRFSSFTYGPMLCATLLFCSALPPSPHLRTIISTTVLSVVIGLFFLATTTFSAQHILGNNLYSYTHTIENSLSNIVSNAEFFVRGRFSLKDAYQNQQGWPGRMPWGGIYPPMEKVLKVVGYDTPVYSMHIHSYCMLPGCRIYGFMSTRTTPNLEVVLFGKPQDVIQSLKRAGINFFFVSKELKLYTPLALSPVLSPDHIDQYLGVKWTDGTSYLLTWLDEGVQPLHQDFLTAYRDLVKESPTISSFPISDWRSVFTYFGKNGLHPYHLPWCTTCEGMPSDQQSPGNLR